MIYYRRDLYKLCPYCGKQFSTDNRKKHYCSVKCKQADYRKRLLRSGAGERNNEQ